MGVLRLTCRAEAAGFMVDLVLEGLGPRRVATARLGPGLTAQDQEDVRWYLEEYLQYPVEPAPQIARRVEERLAVLGEELFTQVFRASTDTKMLWDAIGGSLGDLRVEVVAGAEGLMGVPWELLRDPASHKVLALEARAFVRSQPQAGNTTSSVLTSGAAGALRVLLVICRPNRQADVPFRSVAGQLLRLSRQARAALQLDVLRPPSVEALTRELSEAKAAGTPYNVVHFDGHGIYLDLAAAGGERSADEFSPGASPLAPRRPGAHGYLEFEDQLAAGPELGRVLAEAGVPVLVLNACRSAHADLVTAPRAVTTEADAHGPIQAYGSLAQEVMDAGVPGVVAMRYNVYVATAAEFMSGVYKALLDGRPLGAAVTAARQHLAAQPLRQIAARPMPLQDWIVPVVFEATPLVLRASPTAAQLVTELSHTEAGSRNRADPVLPPGPEAGFYGRGETLLALDRGFDTRKVLLLHGYAGAGKTSAALEFARWYTLTSGVDDALFTQFTQDMSLARLLGQVRSHFGRR